MLGDRAGAALYGPARVSFSPDGQLLAMAARPEGVRIARAGDGVGLAFLPIGVCDEAMFMPSGDLLTCNGRGLCRWPVRQIARGGLRIGPPEPLAAIASDRGRVNRGLAASADGHLVGAASLFGQGSMLLDPDHPWRRKLLVPHQGAADLAISPDGRWAASASRGEADNSLLVKVWDASTGKSLVQLPLGAARVAFSPDSRWLGVGGEGSYRFFRTGSWTPGPKIEHGENAAETPLTFHPSSKVAAVLDSSLSIVRIVDVEYGDVLAKLDAPEQSHIYCLAFSPDGRFLAASQSDQRVDLWDLSSIRQRLEALGLAGGLPDIFGGAGAVSDAPPIDRIEVHGADAAGLRVLAARQTLTNAWHNVRLPVAPRLKDPEEMLQRGNGWNRLGNVRLAEADYRASLLLRRTLPRQPTSWHGASRPSRIAATRQRPSRGREKPCSSRLRWAAITTLSVWPSTAPVCSPKPRASSSAMSLATEATPVTTGCFWRCAGNAWATMLLRAALDRAREWLARMTRIPPADSASFQAFIREAESLLKSPLPDFPADVFSRK